MSLLLTAYAPHESTTTYATSSRNGLIARSRRLQPMQVIKAPVNKPNSGCNLIELLSLHVYQIIAVLIAS